MYQILLSVGTFVVRGTPYSPPIKVVTDSDFLGLVSKESMKAHEDNSRELFEFDTLSYECPSVDSRNNHTIDPLQQVDASPIDTQTVEPAPQAHILDPSLLTTGLSVLNDTSSRFPGLGSLDSYTPSNPMIGSVAQTLLNNPFHIHQPMQFFPTPESIDTGVYFQHSHTNVDHSQFGTMGNATAGNAFNVNAGSEWSYDHSMLQDANTTTGPYSLPAVLSNSGSLSDCYNGEDLFGSLQPLLNSTVSTSSSHSLVLPDSQQSRPIQQQILNGTPSSGAPSRRLFGPPRTIKTLPPPRRGGRRGPLSASQLDQRRRAKKQGICIRCRKLKTKASNPNFYRSQIRPL
jgi:hypothetical protein